MFKELLTTLFRGAVKGAAEEAFSGKVKPVEGKSAAATIGAVSKQVGIAAAVGAVKYGLPGSLMLLGAQSLLSVECVQQIGVLIGSLLNQ